MYPMAYQLLISKVLYQQPWDLLYQEYVASLIGLYKDNGAVSCVEIYFSLELVTLTWQALTSLRY